MGREMLRCAQHDSVVHWGGPKLYPLVQISLQDAARLRMTQLTNRTFLDLAYSFASHLQLLAHLLQRVVMIIEQAKTQFNHLPFTQRQLPKYFTNLLMQQLPISLLHRPTIMRILNNIAQRIFLLIRERSIQRKNLLRKNQQLTHPIRRHAQPLTDVFRRRLPPEFLVQLASRPLDTHHLFHNIHRQSHRACTFQNRTRNRLLNPPRRIGRETEPLTVVKLRNSADETYVAL